MSTSILAKYILVNGVYIKNSFFNTCNLDPKTIREEIANAIEREETDEKLTKILRSIIISLKNSLNQLSSSSSAIVKQQQNQQPPPPLNQPQAIITNENLNYVFAIGYAVKLRPHLFIKQPAFLEVTKNKSNLKNKKSRIFIFNYVIFCILVFLHKSFIHKQTWESTRQRIESVGGGWNSKIEKSSLGAYISIFSNEWLHSTSVNMQYLILCVRERS